MIPTRPPTPGFEPPPTRTSSRPAADYRVQVDPVPEVPESGLWASVRYPIAFARARWQRRGAIRGLREQIAADTSALDGVLGNLGREVRALGVNNRTLAAENEAIDDAERRKSEAEHDSAELATRQAEENAKFAEIEQDRQSKVTEAETALDTAEQELGSLEAQRRGLRDKRKEIERRQRGYVKAAEERDEKGAKSPMGDERIALRKDAENLRREAAALDPERQDIERRVERAREADRPGQRQGRVAARRARVVAPPASTTRARVTVTASPSSRPSKARNRASSPRPTPRSRAAC